MALQKIIKFTDRFEDPKHPLLGPNLNGLYFFGLLSTDNKMRNIFYITIHAFSVFFVTSQVLEMYLTRQDINTVLYNFSVTAPSVLCCFKVFSVVIFQSKWKKLAKDISQEELTEIQRENKKVLKAMQKYTKYARFVTYSYCSLIFTTVILLVLTPLLKYLLIPNFREDLKAGVEQYPQILNTWFPFDKYKMPGYVFSLMIQLFMTLQGIGVIAIYDTNAVTVMTFLKGQMCILRNKCMEIFDAEEEDQKGYLARVVECHRHHNLLLKQHNVINFLLSPVMFAYILVCSISICCTVVQLNSKDIPVYQKMWVAQLMVSQLFQLLIYCWHSNEVLWESTNVDRGIFASNWWKADVSMKRHLLLLAGKLNQPLVLSAGPFTDLSVPTFINAVQGAYSFYTLISKMHDS